MKQLIASVALLAVMSIGCSDNQSTVITEGIQQSDIDKYNEMMAQSNASMEESDEAQKAYEKNPPKN
ncbi:MAG: hypothetical protein AAF745_04280 [Planctomycetota bacterium]